MAPIVWDLELDVQYGFVFLVACDAEWPELIAARGGQANGLCGAAFPEALALVTGTHTGSVPFRLEILDAEPPVDEAWEEIVEVSFVPQSTHLALCTFDSAEDVHLPRLATYRARYCASGMDAAHDADPRDESDPVIDRYLLLLWPDEVRGEAIRRVTSESARYWHGVAEETPAPATPAEREQIAQHRAAEAIARAEKEQRAALAAEWGGEPTDALRALGPMAPQLARRDRGAAELIAAAPTALRREMAVWACEQVCAVAADGQVDWRPALAAIRSGHPLPPPFDNLDDVARLLFPVDTAVVSVAWSAYEPPPRHMIDPRSAALQAVEAANDADLGVAACSALEAAASAFADDRAFLARFRERFAATAR